MTMLAISFSRRQTCESFTYVHFSRHDPPFTVLIRSCRINVPDPNPSVCDKTISMSPLMLLKPTTIKAYDDCHPCIFKSFTYVIQRTDHAHCHFPMIHLFVANYDGVLWEKFSSQPWPKHSRGVWTAQRMLDVILGWLLRNMEVNFSRLILLILDTIQALILQDLEVDFSSFIQWILEAIQGWLLRDLEVPFSSFIHRILLTMKMSGRRLNGETLTYILILRCTEKQQRVCCM